MIFYPDIAKSIKTANELLSRQKQIMPVIELTKMDFGDKWIVFDTLQNFARITDMPLSILLHDRQSPLRDGITIYHKKEDIHIILYNEDVKMRERLRWTLSHEIAHVLLGHIEDGNKEEVEANAFAAQLLMPWFTIRMMGNIRKPSAQHIAKTFGVSIAAANNRIMDLQKMNIRPSFADKLIYSKQRQYIKEEPHEAIPIDILNKIIVASNR